MRDYFCNKIYLVCKELSHLFNISFRTQLVDLFNNSVKRLGLKYFN